MVMVNKVMLTNYITKKGGGGGYIYKIESLRSENVEPPW